jgi:oxygen-independent coproporphyrinogen-3 oxidase
MTLGEAPLQSAAQAEDLKNYLHEMLADQLVEITPERISISPQGKPFLRNACMGLDLRLRHEQPQTRIFSQSV